MPLRRRSGHRADLTQFQSRKTQQREQNRDDQKSENDLRLLPPQQLKMVVEWRHLENAFAAQFERGNLDHHRQAFEHKEAAEHRKDQFRFVKNSHGSDREAVAQVAYYA